MYDKKFCNMCREGSKVPTPCSYCGLRDGQAKEFKKMHKEALAETLKVVSYEGQFSELHRKASIQEENDELKAEIHRLKALARSNKFFTEKRHEDLMEYQDKQNEEIEKLNRAVKQLKKTQTDYVETVIRIENLRIAEEAENTKLKAENKTLRKKAAQEIERQRTEIEDLRELLDGERTCFGCKADITATGGLPIVCQKCDCKDNWEAK